MRRCPVETVEPFALMLSPVYVFMRRNEKFISVKAPLDFFTPDELAKLRGVELFFMPQFIDTVLPFRDLARRMRMLLNWIPNSEATSLSPSSYELADASLRLLGPIWGRQVRLEPFFVTTFVNELCSLLPGDELVTARERDVSNFERAIIVSAWMVFLSLHAGITDLAYLDSLRLDSFRRVVWQEGRNGDIQRLDSCNEAGELFTMLNRILVGENALQPLGFEYFATRKERIARKIVTRLDRVLNEKLQGNYPLEGTIYGAKGFADG